MLRASRMVSQEANGGEGSNERALAGGHRVGVAPVRKKNASHPPAQKKRVQLATSPRSSVRASRGCASNLMSAPPRCHYIVLDVERTATATMSSRRRTACSRSSGTQIRTRTSRSAS